MTTVANNDGTASGTESGTPAAAPEGAAAAAPVIDSDELAKLNSRNSGLNAKVTDLQKQLEAERAARATAEAAVGSNEKADESLRKQIADLNQKLLDGEKATALATAGAKYPEAFAVLGAGIAGMPTENLVALEARLTGAKDPGEVEDPPKVVGNNQQRTASGNKNIDDMTSAELQAYMRTLDPSVMGLS